MLLVRALVDLVDPVARQRRVRQLQHSLVVRVTQPLPRHRLRLRCGLVQLVKDNHVGRHRLHSDRRLHAPQVQMGLTDPLQTRRIRVPHQLLQKRVICKQGPDAGLREVNHVGPGGEVVHDIQAIGAGVDAAEHRPRRPTDLRCLREHDVPPRVVVDRLQVLVPGEGKGLPVKPDPPRRPLRQRLTRGPGLRPRQLVGTAPHIAPKPSRHGDPRRHRVPPDPRPRRRSASVSFRRGLARSGPGPRGQ